MSIVNKVVKCCPLSYWLQGKHEALQELGRLYNVIEADEADHNFVFLQAVRTGLKDLKMNVHAPSEVDSTLQRLSQHRGVRGVLILSNDTGRVIQHTGAMLEGPPGATNEPTGNSTAAASSVSDPNEDLKEVTGPANGPTGPMVNATVRKYADAVRHIVASSREAVQGLDEKVRP